MSSFKYCSTFLLAGIFLHWSMIQTIAKPSSPPNRRHMRGKGKNFIDPEEPHHTQSPSITSGPSPWRPSRSPTEEPARKASTIPSQSPTMRKTTNPSIPPTDPPSRPPSTAPTVNFTESPTSHPSHSLSSLPTLSPMKTLSTSPSERVASYVPTNLETYEPSQMTTIREAPAPTLAQLVPPVVHFSPTLSPNERAASSSVPTTAKTLEPSLIPTTRGSVQSDGVGDFSDDSKLLPTFAWFLVTSGGIVLIGFFGRHWCERNGVLDYGETNTRSTTDEDDEFGDLDRNH